MGVHAGTLQLGPAVVAWARPRRFEPWTALSALSATDLARFAELAPGLRARFVVGRLLIHAVVAGLFPRATGWAIVAGACPRCGRLHAGVRLEGVPACASVSYAADLVVVAVAPAGQVSRLGVDVEDGSADPVRIDELRRRIGASAEPVVHRWTRVQSVLKADGRGLLIDPGSVHLRRGGGWIAGQAATYAVAEVPGPPGYRVSLAWCSVVPEGAVPAQTGRRMTGEAGSRWMPRPPRGSR